jgi:A/G-specific adenine glycosylase
MDYGTWLKTQVPNPNKRSRHYSVQTKFEGSARQLRGQILKTLLNSPSNQQSLQKTVGEKDSQRFNTVLGQLENEGFIKQTKKVVELQ